MANILLLYEPKSDTAALSWGTWTAGSPLDNIKNRDLSKVARSAAATLTSTRFRVALPAGRAFRALVLGPMNVTKAYQYRIRTWSSSAFDTQVETTGWIAPLEGFNDEKEWEDENFWTGITPFDDTERGVYLIHDFGDDPFTARYWSFEIDDTTNPDGYVQIGRLFMPSSWQPTVNYGYGNNGLSFRDNSLRGSPTLAGNPSISRRVNPRVFRASFDYLPESEGYAKAYRLFRVAGFDGEVFVIPDPEDLTGIQQRSFLGTIQTMDAIGQAAFGMVGTGFEILETI